MPLTCHFLSKNIPLATQVAEILLEGLEQPFDLSQTQVWVPTAGAGRRIRYALAGLAADQGSGVLSPALVQPMRAMVDGCKSLASVPEREAAWSRAISTSPPLRALFPDGIPGAEKGLLQVGGVLKELCDLLAEGGFDPLHPQLADVCSGDADRWEEIGQVYKIYLRILEDAGLEDPNAFRLRLIQSPVAPVGRNRIVVACIPDLPEIACRYLSALAENGVDVQILVWRPGTLPAGFDRWGRPIAAEWRDGLLSVENAALRVLAEPEDEAAAALEFLSETGAGDYSLVLADETLAPAFISQIAQAGKHAFQPEGRRLAETDPAAMILDWHGWTGGDLRSLRTVLHRERIGGWLAGKTKISRRELLSACEYLICEVQAQTLRDAREFLAGVAVAESKADDRNSRAKTLDAASALVEAVESVSASPFWEILREIWPPGESTAADEVLELWNGIAGSPLFEKWPQGRTAAFARALKDSRISEGSSAGMVELSGWLEAAWSPATRMAVCGCAEGSIPSSVTSHPFLPNSKRAELGLLENERRLARDAYLLACLVNVRGKNLQLSFSRVDMDGSPSLPSRLLLRCAEIALPERVLELFRKPESHNLRPASSNRWKWNLVPEKPRVVPIKISPTGFKSYLACPFRYYLEKELWLERPDPDARELDALQFGILLHAALEAFGRNDPQEGNAGKIELAVRGYLDAEVKKAFGPNPSPMVLLQVEAAKIRLQRFAQIQAQEFAKGWRILEVERKSAGDVSIAGMQLSAKIDRIEQHPQHGLRIIDYKSSGKGNSPEETHLGSASLNEFLPEAKVQVGKRQKCWIDLQLPLYRHIAQTLHPGSPVQTAYFTLAEHPEDSGIFPLELNEDLFASAMHCAEAVADRVRRGVFWPPQPHRGLWEDPFAAFFLNGKPEECFDDQTIQFLQGDSL